MNVKIKTDISYIIGKTNGAIKLITSKIKTAHQGVNTINAKTVKTTVHTKAKNN